MTTGQTISLLDQADFARFDDDGGAPTPLRPQPTGTGARPADPTSGVGVRVGVGVGTGGPRLSLTPLRGQGSFDGGWWPRTLSLADELPELVTELAAADETVTRVSVNGDTWTDIPGRLAQPGRPALRVSWYRTLDPHVVTVGGGARPRIRLLVIPPDAAPGPAREVLRLLATTGRLPGTPGQILHDAGVASPEQPHLAA
jgi:hypothetical protein